jgi:hypothetical protein
LTILNRHFNHHKKFKNSLTLQTKNANTFSIKYSLTFKSIIPLGTIKNIRLILQFKPQTNKSKKLLVKQSYMLFTWMFYIENNLSSCKTNTTPRFFIRPTTRSKFTQIKAPMAHKTFSQEQFVIKSYSLQISFTSRYNLSKNSINSLNKSVLVATSLRKFVPFLETNLFFLKKITFHVHSSDRAYLKLF